MEPKDVVRNNVLLAEHHVEDAEKSDSEDVVQSSLEDIDESLTAIKNTLPRKDRMSIQEKLAAVQARDQAIAFQFGFAKAAAVAGLTQDEVVQVYEVGVKLAAAEEQLKVSTPDAAIKPATAPKEEKREKKETKPRVAGAEGSTNESTAHTVSLPAAIKSAMAKRAAAPKNPGDFIDESLKGKPRGYYDEKPAKPVKPTKPAVGSAPKVK